MTTPSKTTIETGTTALTGLRCYKIRMITATVFSVLTGAGGDALSGATFPALFVLEGNFSAITLASGSIVFYEI